MNTQDATRNQLLAKMEKSLQSIALTNRIIAACAVTESGDIRFGQELLDGAKRAIEKGRE